MRYSKRYIIFTIFIALLLLAKFRYTKQSYAKLEAFRGAQLNDVDWNPLIAASSNQGRLVVSVDGHTYTNKADGVYMDGKLRVMFPVPLVMDAFDCSAYVRDGDRLFVEKREDVLKFNLGMDNYFRNGEKQTYTLPFLKKGGTYYIAVQPLARELGYSYKWDMAANTVTALDTATDASSILPYRYDMREKGRAPQIRNQGPYGTCWAFASLAALESSLLPEERMTFSVDHMNQNNSFSSGTSEGGQYTMAMAYLAAWQGPVLERDDPYGDGSTDNTLAAVRHVQDMHIIEAKDFEHIKEAVFKYGGVESCIYTTMQGSYGVSDYYNSEKHAYCYVGEEKPNHDVVIIGWDDSYPKENFSANLEGDGAFICQNSWGEDFGDNGVFYVSYYDTNIGIHNLVYTGVEDVDNYGRIYQSDLCGWVGQMGYNKESVYGANVFTAQEDEQLVAAGFYATGRDTSYKVYVVPQFEDKESLNTRIPVAQGLLTNAGYHTIDFSASVAVKKGQKFAVVLWLSTPNAVRPMAIEYAADSLTQDVVLDDGEGYVSAQGKSWVDAKESSQCNLCIKAFAGGKQQ